VLVLVDPKDARAIRNKDNILGMYDLMINKRKPEEAAARLWRLLTSSTIRSLRMAQTPRKVLRPNHQGAHTRRVDVQKIVAVGDYVWSHMNSSICSMTIRKTPGSPAFDIFRMDADGKAIEQLGRLAGRRHLQRAPPIGLARMYPLQNSNGMF